MKKSKILSVVFASLMFLFPMIVKAEGEVVSINDQDLYATLEAALADAESGDTISLIQNLEIAADTTIPAGITLKNTTNTLTIAAERTLTINGKLETSSNSSVVINGTLAIVSGGIVDNNSTFTLKGTIRLEGNAVMNIGGVLDLQTNSNVVSTVAGPIVNINKTGSIIGSASSLSTAHNTVFNNYAGRMGASLTATLGDGMYKYYPIYDTTNDRWYQTFDEIEAGVSATVLAPHIVNGDTTIAEGVQITGAAGVATTVNGTFTINGSYGMENGYTSIVAHNLYGSGTVTLNQATEMATSWWTYVTILHDVSRTLTFEAMSGYNPEKDDILFELGSNTDDAIAIAAKIKLGNTFGTGVGIKPKASNLGYTNGGTLLGVLGDKVVEDSVDTSNPDTGNGDLFILGFITTSALVCAAYCARRIYLLNRI